MSKPMLGVEVNESRGANVRGNAQIRRRVSVHSADAHQLVVLVVDAEERGRCRRVSVASVVGQTDHLIGCGCDVGVTETERACIRAEAYIFLSRVDQANAIRGRVNIEPVRCASG